MVLRGALLYLSRNRSLRRWMETSPAVTRLTSRFVAGLTLDDALTVSEKLRRERILVSLDHLGESVTSLQEAADSRDSYLEALGRLSIAGFDASVSIKLSQFGLDLSETACRANVERLVSEAARHGRMVEIDMESSEHLDRTLAIAIAMHQAYGNVRTVIQAYLHRSGKDLERLCEIGVPLRLCKGAYNEPPAAAMRSKRDVDANYVRLMKILMERGVYPGIATHDEKIINEAHRFARERGIQVERYESQMLYGIRRDLARRFVRDGYRIRLYVPYGVAWYPYFMRRLAERPANLVFLMRNLLKG
jgi:proline dehydrogenase